MAPVTPPGPSPSPSPRSGRQPVISRLVAVGMLAAVVAVAVVVATAVIVLTSTDESSGASGWNTLVAVDRVTGVVTVFDESGDRVDRISTGVDEPTPHMLSPSHVVLDGLRSDRSAIAVVDIESGDVIDVDTGVDPDEEDQLRVQPVRGADAVVIGSDIDPGSALLLTPDGDVVDIGDEAGWDDPFIVPTAVRATPDGSHVAFVNLGADQEETAVVGLEDLDVTVVDGREISLSNDRVRTAIRSGDRDRLDIETYDLSGERMESIEVAPFRIAIAASNGDVITADDEGEIVRWSTDGDSERIVEFDDGDGAPSPRFGRTDGVVPALAVADADGEVLIVTAEGDVFDDVALDAPVDRFDVGRRCLPVITETSVAIIESSTGEVLAEEELASRTTFLAATDADGCTALAFAEEPVLISADDVVDFGPRESLVGLSTDGTAYAVRDDRDVEVRGLGDRASDDDISLDVDETVQVLFLHL